MADYGGELPDELDDDMKHGAEGASADELEAMKVRLKEMEEEAAKLREMQDKVQKEMTGGAGAAGGVTSAEAAAAAATKEEVDSRSIFVGQVDYGVTPEELQVHFQSCGTVERVTILTTKTGQPKGYAYLEFLEPDAVAAAVLLNDTDLRGRKLKVTAKRTNVPGMRAGGRGGGRGGRGGFRGGFGGGAGYFPPPMFMPFGYGAMPYGGMPFAPRGRGRGRGGRRGGRGQPY